MENIRPVENLTLDCKRLGARLKKERIRKHMTQTELSEKANFSVSNISHLEKGTYAPSLKTMIKICNVLEIGIDGLLYDTLSAVSSSYLNKDFAELLADCSAKEKRVLLKILEVTKNTMREEN